jgi:hypothetical protein
MLREFAIVRVKKVAAGWEYPIAFDEVRDCPLAGGFDELTKARLDLAIGQFPFARRTGDGRRAWTIEAPSRGSITAWLTSDGSLFVEGHATLPLYYALYAHLAQVVPALAMEDRITGLLHNRQSFLRLVRHEEHRNLPWDEEADPNHTPPMAA